MMLGVSAPDFYRDDEGRRWNNYQNRYHDLHVDLMDVLSGLRERRARVERRREKYLEMHADGVTSRDELRTQIAKLDAERMRLDALPVVTPAPSASERRAVLRSVGRVARQWVGLQK
jgi:hypothetical protein